VPSARKARLLYPPAAMATTLSGSKNFRIPNQTPTNHFFVRTQGQAVPAAGSNGHHVAQARRHIGLAISLLPQAISSRWPKRQTVCTARRHRHHIGRTGRHIGLAIVVIAPSHHTPVRQQRKTMTRGTSAAPAAIITTLLVRFDGTTSACNY